MDPVLTGDIGGTKSLLAMARLDSGGSIRLESLERFDSGDYEGPEDLLREYLSGKDRPGRACLGVPCPIRDDRPCETPNLPWRFTGPRLADETGLGELSLVNDFAAVARSLPELVEEDSHLLRGGHPSDPEGPRVVLGPGTGLGAAFLVRTEAGHEVLASEAGHLEFAPQGPVQRDLLATLEQEHQHVSWERVLSGAGLEALYQFAGGRAEVPRSGEDAELAPRITQAAREKTDPAAIQAWQWFAELLGAFAGDLALTILTTGGVYLAGGILPKVLDFFSVEAFETGFLHKGRMRETMRPIPVRVVTRPEAPLLGAAAFLLR